MTLPASGPTPAASPLRRIPLCVATEDQVLEAVDVAAPEHRDPIALAQSMLDRRDATLDGLTPSVIDLIADRHGMVGWAGWAVYTEDVPGLDPTRTWQSTTFFAPRWRGVGLLDQARCWQAHLATEIALVSEDPTLISSIDVTNARSLAASRSYARRQNWLMRETSTWEERNDRVAVILEWPEYAAVIGMHTCYEHFSGGSSVASSLGA